MLDDPAVFMSAASIGLEFTRDRIECKSNGRTWRRDRHLEKTRFPYYIPASIKTGRSHGRKKKIVKNGGAGRGHPDR
jgi:hypothetical protein